MAEVFDFDDTDVTWLLKIDIESPNVRLNQVNYTNTGDLSLLYGAGQNLVLAYFLSVKWQDHVCSITNMSLSILPRAALSTSYKINALFKAEQFAPVRTFWFRPQYRSTATSHKVFSSTDWSMEYSSLNDASTPSGLAQWQFFGNERNGRIYFLCYRVT